VACVWAVALANSLLGAWGSNRPELQNADGLTWHSIHPLILENHPQGRSRRSDYRVLDPEQDCVPTTHISCSNGAVTLAAP
jgi:hypothetical protein